MRPEPPRDAETVAEVGEFNLIHRVTTGRAQPETTILGPGDDAAVVAVPDGRVVASMDVLVEGVHFRLDWSSPEQVGRKAAAVNLADVVAMGALPSGLLVGIACPPDTPAATVQGIMSGLWQEAAQAGAGIVGGDMVSSATLVISITAMGDMNGLEPITRSGALVGDVVAVTGRLGWAAAGFAVALLVGFLLPRNLFPPFSQGEFRFNITLPPGTALHVTDQALEALAAEVRKDSRIKIVHTSVGQIDLEMILRPHLPRTVFRKTVPRAGDDPPPGRGEAFDRGMPDAAAGAGEQHDAAGIGG